MRATIFGESHGSAAGVVLEGVPPGLELDLEQISREMARRAPGRNVLSTARKEMDVPQILSGLLDGRTTGAPLCAIIPNGDARPADYEKLKHLPRPGHADYAAFVRYGGNNDVRGGGHFSGRLTAPLVFAGAVARQFLALRGVFVGGHLLSAGGVSGERFDALRITREKLDEIAARDFPAADDGLAQRMKRSILAAGERGDSVGGVVECAVLGLPAGIGEPGAASLESLISKNVFAVPGVKGIEFGAGFGFAGMTGGEANDQMTVERGAVKLLSNHNGGVSGGISNGAPVIFRAVLRPTPSIAMKQKTADLIALRPAELVIEGRHDPCIAPRALPVVEAAAALAVTEALEKTGGERYVGQIQG